VFVVRVRVRPGSRSRLYGHEHEGSASPLNLFEQSVTRVFQQPASESRALLADSSTLS
jgi:hypothetical protein